MSDLTIDNYLSYFSPNEINDICEPLFNSTEIDYFLYTKIYLDGTRIFLTTHNDFLKWSYGNKHFVSKQINSIQTGIHLTKDLPKFIPSSESSKINTQIIGAYNYFNINFIENGIDLIFKNCSEFYEVFEFASSINNRSLVDFYMNNLDILNHFALYFKDRAKKLIKIADKNKPGSKNNLRLSSKILDKNINRPRKNFYQATRIKSIPITSYNCDIYLSSREIECLAYLILGYSAKETAKIVSISPKTVEFYIDSSKQKLCCHSTSELIKKIFKFNIISYNYLATFIS